MAVITRALDIPVSAERRWLVTSYVPARELTLVTGERKSGKGLALVSIAMSLSRGERVPWDLLRHEPIAPHAVVWVTGRTPEDPPEELRDRFQAAGGDLGQFTIVELGRSDGITELRRVLEARGPKLVVLDPLQAAIGDLAGRLARDRMEDLVGLARETESTFLCIRHIKRRGRAEAEGSWETSSGQSSSSVATRNAPR